MYPYEGMFLVDPVLHTADSEATEKVVKDLLAKHGAKVTTFERWDERKLAYEIQGHKRGVYLLVHFEMPGENVDAMRRETRIIEAILRLMVIRIEDDIPAHMERAARYYDKVREDQEHRRAAREGRGDENEGMTGAGGAPAPAPAVEAE